MSHSRFDPLKTWAGHGQLATKLNRESVIFSPESRRPRDISGKTVGLEFELSDKLKRVEGQDQPQGLSAPYTVTVKVKGVGIQEMNAGNNPVVGVSKVYEAPGTYVAVSTLQIIPILSLSLSHFR